MSQLFRLGSVAETIAAAAEAAEIKCRLKFGQVIVLAVIASAYLALATTLSIAVAEGIAPAGLQKLVMGAVFPVGLIAVLVAVSELSTGNYLITPLGAMALRVNWRQTVCQWARSYAGNFLGALLLAMVIINGAHLLVGPMWGAQWTALLEKIVIAKTNLSPAEAFFRAILCIWLVDLAVWQAYRVKDTTSKFLLIWFPTCAFFALGLEHSVVNMFLFPAAIFAGAPVTWGQFLANNLLPVVAGNVAGGVFIVGMLYWYSAGMPLFRKAEGTPSDGHFEQGSHRLLLATILRAAASTIAFIVLLPGIAAALAMLVPQLGLLVPLIVTVYLATAAYLLPYVLGSVAKSPTPTVRKPVSVPSNGTIAAPVGSAAAISLQPLIQGGEDSISRPGGSNG